MIKINVDTSGLMRLRAEVNGMGKQVRFATMRALNAAAFKAKQETEREIVKAFDSPTPWVQKSVRYVKATKDRLEAQVDFDAWGNKQGVTASSVLNAEIYGGSRRMKRFEKALNARGILPSGMVCVPGDRVPRDSYGNISPGLINQVLSWFDAFGEMGYRANMYAAGREKRWRSTKKKTGFEFFAIQGKIGKLLPGIYIRKNYGSEARARVAHLKHDAAYPVFIFVRTTNYKRRLDFYGMAEKVARAEFDAQFPAMLTEAMRTAR